ncbi:hypothetical protein G9A89_019137 [Geosiphon pyriformis]|nr:hypothetical protein G9A89_019137 [Geosiphon pyriformis]
MINFGLTDKYWMHDSLDQGKVFSLLLWKIFYDHLLCEVKRQESLCKYCIDSKFVAKTGRLENQNGLTSFLAAGAFVDDTIWVGSSQAATQYILDIASNFFSINNISINNKKTVVIPINKRVGKASLSISGSLILIACKEKFHRYLGIYLLSESLSKPSLAKTHLDIRFFVNLVLKKAILDKQFLYLVLAVLQSIVSYRSQFSFLSKNAKCKVASVLNFSNAGGLLGHLFVYRSFDLQVLSWLPIHSLCRPVRLHISPVNNFLAGVVKVFLNCDMSFGNFSHTAFCFSGGTLMSSVLGNYLFYEVSRSLKRSGVAFVKQLYTKKDLVFDWKSFCCWKRLNPHGLVSRWFNLACEFLVYSLHVGLPVIELKLQDVGGSDDIFCLKQSLITSDLCVIEVYTDGSLKNFGTQKMGCSTAAYFPDVNQDIGIRVGGLVSFTLAELQAIALALECVLFCSSVIIYSDSQAVLDRHGIFNLIKRKGLGVFWRKIKEHLDIVDNECADKLADFATSLNLVLLVLIKEMFIKADGVAVFGNAGPGSAVIGKNMIGNVDWVRTALVWHPNSHMTAGFTSRSMAGLHLYFLKALYYCLPVAVQKHLYNKSYPSVLCFHYGEVESFNYSFIYAFDLGVHKNLLTSYLAKWHSMSDVDFYLSQISQMLSLSISDDVLYTTLGKGFLFKDWYLEAVSVLDDIKLASKFIIDFV